MTDAVNLLPTPFHERLAAFNLNHSWESWEGWLSVGCFDNEVREYFAVRNAATLYDISPMTQYRVEGPAALAFLDRLVTRDMARVAAGRAAYALWCDDDGKVVEDGTIFRLGEARYLINVQEHNLAWFKDTAFGFDVEIEDVTEELAGLAVQGPLSRQLLVEAGIADAADLGLFACTETEADGMDLVLSRTGFTGDLGFELFCRPKDALKLWDRLFDTPLGPRVVPIGSRALDMARIEAGFLQVNTDFIPAEACLRPGQRRSPFELGFDRLVHFDKQGYFVGRRALLAELAAGGPRRRTVGLDIVGNKPAEESFLYDGDREVGLVTSAFWSPTVKKNLAIATVERGCDAIGTTLQADIWFRKELKIEKLLMPARVVPRPFYDPPHRRG